MSNNIMVTRVENDRVLVIERIFNAPRDLVFTMFKDENHLKHWWSPKGWELSFCKVDFQPYGTWHYCMKCNNQADGQFSDMESWGKAVYKEIIEPEKIVFTDYFSDSEGIVDDSLPATEITMEFIDLYGKTKLINRSEYVSADALKTVTDMGVVQGIGEAWDRLDELVESLK